MSIIILSAYKKVQDFIFFLFFPNFFSKVAKPFLKCYDITKQEKMI